MTKPEMQSVWLCFIAVFAAAFWLFEAYGFVRYGTPGTLSANVRYWTSLHPIIPYLLGLLVMWLAFHFWASR